VSTPNEPTNPDQPGYDPNASPDAQPTQAYPDAAQTQAYPPAYGQPGAAGQPGYAQPGYGQPAYGQPAYAQPVAPAGPDTRPKRLGWIALSLGIAGVVLMIVSWFTAWFANVGIFVAALALLVGTVAIVLGIIVLAKKTEGFKVGGVLGIVGGVLAGIAWFSLFVSLAITGLYNAGSLTPTPESTAEVSAAPSEDPSLAPSEEPSASPTDDTTAGATGDEAFLAEVRPQLDALFSEIDGSVTPEMISSVYTDEMLLTLGESFATAEQAGILESMRDTLVSSLAGESGGVFSEEQANRFFDIIADAAAAHLS